PDGSVGMGKTFLGSMIVTSNRGADPVRAPERHRSLHQQRLPPDHRRRVLPAPPETESSDWLMSRMGSKAGCPTGIRSTGPSWSPLQASMQRDEARGDEGLTEPRRLAQENCEMRYR